MDTAKTIGFIGFGLIGGSLAKGIREAIPHHRMIAYNHRKESILPALSDGTLDRICSTPEELAENADIIYLCAPVEQNSVYLEKISSHVRKDAIISDVGSTKSAIHKKAQELGLDSVFIGGHPMAGSEKFGYQYSKAFLFENAWYILTPTDQTPPEKLQILSELAKACRALPVILDPERHDHITAAISHVPHLIAAALVNLVKREDDSTQMMKQLAAGGFRDITRIASSSPAMWQEICSANSNNISQILQEYIGILEEILNQLNSSSKTYIYDFFDESRTYRDSFPDRSKGSLPQVFALYSDIKDEKGAIATIATQLSVHGISLKNIGIVNNREFEEGILRVEFYDADSRDHAAEVLIKNGHNVTLRN